jgi:hypothetical protein
MYVKCVTHYRSSVLGDIALNIMQIDTIPRAKKNYFGNDVKAAAGRILEHGWTVYATSKGYRILFRKGC